MGTDSNNRTGGGAAYSRFAEEMDIDSVDLSVRGSQTKPQRLKALCLDHWRPLLVLLIALLCLGIGLILGHLTAASCLVESVTNGKHAATAAAAATTAAPTATASSSSLPPQVTDGKPDEKPNTTPTASQPVDYLLGVSDLIQTARLQTNLGHFSQGSHEAGSLGNIDRAEDIFNTWQDYGFDVQKKKYSVLLSRPDARNRNKLQIVDATTQAVIKNFTLNDGVTPNMLQPFAVYGSNAAIVGQPVYVNFATREDFKHLRDLTSIQVEGKLCLARLGNISLAQMSLVSFEQRCSGLIAFRDPKPFANAGSLEAVELFPKSWWLPDSAIPFESTRMTMGDPSSPSFPSHSWMPRPPLSVSTPGFAVQTISYGDAWDLLRVMKTVPASDPNWIGGFETYNVGPGFHAANRALRLEVNNRLAFANITNVIGTIVGAVEPDRYVILGSHRDSLSHGVVSPGTGTACLMEVAGILSDLRKKGWTPRRSIILASWDAGEDGSIGSTEWIEENLEKLRGRGVAYINLDNAVNGNYSLAAAGSPLLAKAIYQASMEVDCPDDFHPDWSVYQDWLIRRPMGGTSNRPRVDPLGQTSDAAPFLMLAGIPSVDLQYTYDEDFYAVPRYPTSQTIFDQAKNIMVFIDSDSAIHTALTEVVVRTLVTLADGPKLTMDLTHYADTLSRYVRDFKAQYGSTLSAQSISLGRLEAAVADFGLAAQDFQTNFDSIGDNDELKLREMNDHILSVERAFLLNEWIPTNPESRHVVYSASPSAVYKGAPFGLLTRMIAMQTDGGDWSVVDQMLGLTTLALQAATGVVNDAQLH